MMKQIMKYCQKHLVMFLLTLAVVAAFPVLTVNADAPGPSTTPTPEPEPTETPTPEPTETPTPGIPTSTPTPAPTPVIRKSTQKSAPTETSTPDIPTSIPTPAPTPDFPMETMLAAAGENKSVGEYMNNAVVAVPGLDSAVPVSQGGNVIINGQPSNQTFPVLKALSGHTDSAKAQAAAVGGKVLNVAKIDASVYFDTATVNFYMPGVKTGQNIQVYQYDYASG